MYDLTLLLGDRYPVEMRNIYSRLLQLDAYVPAKGGVALAGGYIRDLYFKKTPRDMDFVFYGLTPAEFMASVEMWLARTPTVKVLAEYGDDYNGARDGLVPSVLKVDWGGTPTDLILYSRSTLPEVLAAFDHSINEFYARFDSEFRFSVGHRGGWGVCTRNADCDLTPERVVRMQEYAARIGWEYR